MYRGWELRANGVKMLDLNIGELPGRKSMALYTVEGPVLNTLAYFRDEASAEKAAAILEAMIPGVREARQ